MITTMKILSLTPHPCNIQDDNGVIHVADRIETEPGRFLVLRADTIINSTKAVGNFTAKSKSFGKPIWVTVDIDGKNELPAQGLSLETLSNGYDIVVVSLITLQSLLIHNPLHNFYAPGDLLRENGQPIGCVGLTFI